MAFSAAAFAAAAITAAGAIIKQEAENTLNDGPNAIQGPSAPGAINSVAQAIARQTCRRYADGDPNVDEGTAVNLERVCRPYLDDIGYGAGPTLALPFRGGQCGGVLYRIEFSWTTGLGARQFLEQDVGGVIIGTYSDAGNFGNFSVGYITQQPGSPPVKFVQSGTTDPGGGSPSLRVLFRLDGQPDDCGNPDPDFEEPIPPPVPGPDTEPYNPGPDIDIDITVNLKPDALVEVNLGFGPVVIPLFGGRNGNPGGEPGGGAGGATGPAPGDLGTPGPPGETTAGGDLFSEAPPGFVLVGIQLNILSVPIFAREYDVGVYRGAAYIYMGAGALLDHDFGGSMVRDGQFFFAEKDYLTVWRVRATVGYNFRVTPYYREVAE